MTKTLIVPGLDGSPAPHWQHWWASRDRSAVMVALSNSHRPVPEAWETELGETILRHPDCILVAHSLGAVLAARLLAKWPQLRVRAALLVAPAETSGAKTAGAERIAHFGPIPETGLGVPATVVASRNDPWMSFTRARQLARAWGAEAVDLGFAGHVNVASGFGPWARGMALRDELALRSSPVPNPLPRARPSHHVQPHHVREASR